MMASGIATGVTLVLKGASGSKEPADRSAPGLAQGRVRGGPKGPELMLDAYLPKQWTRPCPRRPCRESLSASEPQSCLSWSLGSRRVEGPGIFVRTQGSGW